MNHSLKLVSEQPPREQPSDEKKPNRSFLREAGLSALAFNLAPAIIPTTARAVTEKPLDLARKMTIAEKVGCIVGAGLLTGEWGGIVYASHQSEIMAYLPLVLPIATNGISLIYELGRRNGRQSLAREREDYSAGF